MADRVTSSDGCKGSGEQACTVLGADNSGKRQLLEWLLQAQEESDESISLFTPLRVCKRIAARERC